MTKFRKLGEQVFQYALALVVLCCIVVVYCQPRVGLVHLCQPCMSTPVGGAFTLTVKLSGTVLLVQRECGSADVAV